MLAITSFTASAAIKLTPTEYPDLKYKGEILSGPYKDGVTEPKKILGFAPGQRVASPEQIANALSIWQKESDRLKVVEYGRTHEGRPLFYVVITTPAHLANLENIQKDVQQLANPVNLSDADAKNIIGRLPAIAWMAYSIHGNESSGADAALTAIYHLIASESDDVKQLLGQQVIIIDPMMNPDGRARFSKELEEHRGVAPNVDDQSLLHTGSWPYGRTNHYYFDLNRDFIYLTQPETRGRVAIINQWYPQLMIDGHEMGAQDTYLFAPAREPVNPHLPKTRKKWGWKFAQDQASAFDNNAWRYYTGEWFENLYPGYSNYAEYRGAVHILYEQARIAEDGVKRPDGNVVTYQQSVHHQFVSTIENLRTLAKHSKEMYQDFLAERRESLSSSGPYADRSFAILPTDNKTRLHQLVDTLKFQNIEVFQLTKQMRVSADTQLGGKGVSTILPKGTLIVPNRQQEARLIATMLEFDVDIKPEVLKEERHRTLRDGSSLMYDTTAWNLTMMYGLEAVIVKKHINSNLESYAAASPEWELNPEAQAKDTIAIAVNGEDDASVSFAARLMELGLQVRVVDKATELSQQALPRGTVVVTKTDNPNWTTALEQIKVQAHQLNLTPLSISSGFGDGDLPDWGGAHFRLLTKPRVGLVSRGGFAFYDVGATWYSLDHHLAIRHSKLNSLTFSYSDLRRYNVIILPTQFMNSLSEGAYQTLKTWVSNGGTLIAFDRSARSLIGSDISSVTLLENSFENAEQFDIAIQREWMANNIELEMEAILSHQVPLEVDYPWHQKVQRLNQQQLVKRDNWQRNFMPSGAFVAGRTDQRHWLTFGVSEDLPLLFSNNPLFMSAEESEAVVRVGKLQKEEKGALSKLAESVMDEPKALGWSTLPAETTAHVRMSGLLWPEAAQRMLNAAHTTREALGKGQIILFATSPNFRGSTLGTNRMLLNAIVYGPGLGTAPLVEL